MALLTRSPYKAKEFGLSGLQGISDHTLEIHFGLYAGYVKNTNTLTEQLVELGEKGQAGTPAYAELTRRLPVALLVPDQIYAQEQDRRSGRSAR